MTTAHLREAAKAIRATETDYFHLSVADWLERVARQHETLTAAMRAGQSGLSNRAIDNQTNIEQALATAHAYLGWG